MTNGELVVLRKRIGLTQKEMAMAMGVSLATYIRLEKQDGSLGHSVAKPYALAASYLFARQFTRHYAVESESGVSVLPNTEEAKARGLVLGFRDEMTNAQFWVEPKPPTELTEAQRQLARGAYDRWVSAGHPDPRNMEGSISLLLGHLWAAFENGRRMVPGPAMPMAGEKSADFPQFDASWFKA